ncbi:hypothetical protein [Nocardia brasiliensis]|uniref:hypothetical protein n=1 Tax=Nocardia brasiliensis TaxID=37326 RepID=UPI002454DFF9|nr:hypothetical protein [Nocardia brasiliensis]
MTILMKPDEVSMQLKRLEVIIDALAINLDVIQQTKNGLLIEFRGDGGSGYDETMTALQGRMDQYNTTLLGLRKAAMVALQTILDQDYANGNGFRMLQG